MKSVSSTDLKQSLGDVLATAAREPVTITRHGAPRYVLMSMEAYERREPKDSRRVYRVEDTPDDLADLLIAALDRQIAELDGA
ncbi:MAG: type II toxin-antitoxin system Phd/YefM family antitoxin [Gemmobacter sp.]